MKPGRVWAVALAAAFMAPDASAATVSSATLFDEGSTYTDWTAASNATYLIQGDAREVIVYVTEADHRMSTFRFSAPRGTTLATGVYDRAVEATDPRDRPGIYVSRPSSGCERYDGRFEIKDFALGANGVPTRLWAVFEYRCDELPPQFGEVRYATSRPDGPAFAIPAVQRWAADDFGRPRDAVPVTVRATASAQLGAARLTGTDAGDFAIENDGCSGRQLAAGGSCAVMVRFRPRGPGARTAVLDLGAARSTLQGFSYGGRTRLEITGEPPPNFDPEPEFGVFTPADARIIATGVGSHAWFGASHPDNGWSGSFRGANDAPLVPGHYAPTEPVKVLPYPQPLPGMTISATYGGPCSDGPGDLTITETTHYPDGEVRSFAADFLQHCSDQWPGDPYVRGSIAFRAGDTTPLAPWMTAGAAEPVPAAPAAPPSAGARGCRALRRITGSRRANRLRGSRSADWIVAGRGNDRVRAGGGNDCVDGGGGNDRVSGGSGADRLSGGRGRDVVSGGPGRDVLVGGPGRDRLLCGRGRDVAVASRGDRTRGCERVRRV